MRNGNFPLTFLQKSLRSDTELYQLLYDGHRFAQHFSNTIKMHPLLLYTTALPFTPTNTTIFKKFYHGGLPKVVCGVDTMWPPELLQLRGHDSMINSVALSPDESKIISGSDDNTIRVWDASTGIEILTPLRGHDGSITSIAFSFDGSKITSGLHDRTVRVWDASSGIEILPPLRSHRDSIYSIALSPDGSKIISGSADKTIRVWNASTGIEILPPLRSHRDSIYSIAFSPDGAEIISGSRDRTIRLWDASPGVEMLPSIRDHNASINAVAFSPDGSKIISASNEIIRFWDARTGIEMLPSLRCRHDWIKSMAFSHDGTKIISYSYDNNIRVLDASTGIVLPRPQILADDTPRLPMDEQMVPWESRLTNINTGMFIPVGAGFHCGKLRGSTYVGWTRRYQLVLIHFPER